MYEIYCGSQETMQKCKDRGVRGLNPKTMKWQFVDKTASYKVTKTKRDGMLWNLYSNKNLNKIAEKKGLIL